MATRKDQLREQLSPEGAKLYDMLMKTAIPQPISLTEVKLAEPTEQDILLTTLQEENSMLRRLIEELINNSINVVEDCNKLEKKFATAEEYLQSDIKTAKYIHSNFITRLTAVLDLEDPLANLKNGNSSRS